MLKSTIRNIIRVLIEDNGKSSYEVFEYTSVSTFTIAQTNITITKVYNNGVELTSSQYAFDDITNKITIYDLSPNGLVSGDKIEVDYTYYEYSIEELNKFIEAALSYLNLYSYSSENFYEVSGDEIVPIPSSMTGNLIAIIVSILINPDNNSYRLANISIQYNGRMSKEKRIEQMITKFKAGLGVNDIITWDEHNIDLGNLGDTI